VTDLDFYLNFVLHAVLGKLGEADALMSMAGDEIRATADRLAAKYRVEPRPLYRGMLLDPDVPYALDPKLRFVSWSEDRDVARWFACPRSVVSEPLMATNAKLRGYLVETSSPQSRVLFHHAWLDGGLVNGISALALMHPLMGAEGRRQIEWSLRTQREVITAPVDGIVPIRAADLDTQTLAMLERRLSPPWLIKDADVRT
jgi:hypothetical protein